MRELILITLSDQADIEIVHEVPDEADILEKAETTNPDFLILAQETLAERPNICDTVLRARPDVRIITVALRNNYLDHYWASPDIQSRRTESSEEALLGILRTKPTRGVA
jgi:DNA-binding NarL/FixJ family response regulator